MLRRLTPILLAALLLAAAPSSTLATSGDVAATRAYIKANYELVRAARANLGAGQSAIKRLVRRVVGGCAHAAAGSPQDRNSEQFSNYEVVGALSIAIFRPDAKAIVAFAHAVKGLHWSNRRLTRTAKAYTAKLVGISTMAMPDICADVKAWAASGFQTLSPNTMSFDRRYLTVDIEAEEVPLKLFAPYEGSAQVALLHRTKQLEAPLADAEAKAVYDWTAILDGLEVIP